jgi:hypothetical protein
MISRKALMLRSCLALAAALAALSACGPTAERAPPQVVSFTVRPEVVPVGGGDVVLAWDLAHVDWTELRDVEGSAGDRVPARGSRRVRVESDVTFTVIGGQFSVKAGNPGSARESRTVRVEQLPIEGTLVDHGQVPLVGWEVLVNGEPSGLTDAAGRFAGSTQRMPYTLAFREYVDAWRSVAFHGLTVREGTFPASPVAEIPPLRVPFRLRGAWSGADTTQVQGHQPILELWVLSDAGWVRKFLNAGPVAGDGAFDIQSEVMMTTDDTVDLVFLQYWMWESSTDHGQIYVRAARVENVALEAGGLMEVPSVELQPISSARVPVSLQAGDWLEEGLTVVQVQLPRRVPLELWAQGEDGNVIRVDRPALPFGALSVRGSARGRSTPRPAVYDIESVWFGPVPLPAEGVELSVPAPPRLSEPAILSTVAPEHAVRWSSDFPLCRVTVTSHLPWRNATIYTSATALEGAWRKWVGLETHYVRGGHTANVECFGASPALDASVSDPTAFAEMLRTRSPEARGLFTEFEVAP